MRQLRLALLVLPLVVLSVTAPVQAHFLAIDGNIGVTLHVDPNDDPVANQPATFFFDVADKAGKFTLANCTCQASLLQNGKQIYTQSIAATGFTQAGFGYTFTSPGVYGVRLVGTPLTSNAFQPFTINWNIRAEPGQAVKVVTATLGQQIAIGIGFVVLIAIAVCIFLFVSKKPVRK
jgi:hypothetical protein